MREDNQSGPYYYNVEKTDHPYVLKYTEVGIENVASNFIILDDEYEGYETVVKADHYNRVWNIVDAETLKEVLKLYKEQLLEDKHKIIIDENIITCKYGNFKWAFKKALEDAGLYINRKGEVVIKRIPKPKKTVSEKIKLNQSVINRIFETNLQSFTYNNLGFGIKIKHSAKTMYSILTSVKKMFPEVSWKDLSKDSWYSSEHRIKENTKCEEFWNNPELAKQPTKAPKKEKK